ncbi:MAG TPA: FtsQ-type POTRA domain-containing protein [bacterium]|nr:FtsQ-type POTRA domain-containing protein [bacterium]
MRKALSIIVMTGLMLFVWMTAGVFTAFFVHTERYAGKVRSSDEFAVTPEKVTVEGIAHLTRDEVLLLAGFDRRMSWFDVDEHRAALFIRSNGWIKECEVQTIFPDRVRIRVTEYEPAIVVNRRETEGERGEGLYSIWFADRDGVIFKKAFPREGRTDLPLFFIENEAGAEVRPDLIKQAIAIAAEWRRHADLCSLRSIGYDAFDGFSLECEFPKRRTARIYLGDPGVGDDIIKRRGGIFRDAALRLRDKRLFAGEFQFDARRSGDALIAGQVVHYK